MRPTAFYSPTLSAPVGVRSGSEEWPRQVKQPKKYRISRLSQEIRRIIVCALMPANRFVSLLPLPSFHIALQEQLSLLRLLDRLQLAAIDEVVDVLP